MRIVAGSLGGRPLNGPKDDHGGIRPTSDRTRQMLFNVLGQWMEGLTVLDLFAGTGALGLESISRGAVRAVLVDQGREALGLCRQNAESLGVTAQLEVLGWEAVGAIGRLAKRGDKYDLVFADPPYALHTGTAVLTALDAAAVLQDQARVVIEHEKKESLPESVGRLSRFDQRTLGDTVVSLYRFDAETILG